MASENVEIVRQCFESLSRGDIERALTDASEDFEMDWSNSVGPASGIYRGKDEVREIWESYLDSFATVHWEPIEIKELDDSTVVVASHFRARGRGSGIDVDAKGAQLWVFADGVAVSVQLHQSLTEALDAARRSN